MMPIESLKYPKLNKIDRAFWYRFILSENGSEYELRYKLLVRFISQHTPTSALVLIDRISDVYINDELPSRSFDELAFETGKVFYPLVVEINNRNEWINICNYQQIVEKWNTLLPDIKLRFSGLAVDRYLKQVSTIVSNREKIKTIFENELSMLFFFKIAYQTSKFEKQVTIDLPIGDYAPVPFDVEHTLRDVLNDKGLKEVVHEGINTEENHILEKNNRYENTYSALFEIDNMTNCIQEATAQWNFTFPEKRRIKIILYPLRKQPSEDNVNYKIDDYI